MSRKLYQCPFWLEALDAGQEVEESSLNADENPECQEVASKKLLECESCSFSTENKLDLIVHISETHQNLSYQDPSYKEHIGSKTVSGRRLKCSKCPFLTSFPDFLRWHFQHCHGENPVMKMIRPNVKPGTVNTTGQQSHLQCLLCGVRRKDIGGMVVHLNHAHNIEYPFECDLCHEKFSQERSLSYHQLTHYNVSGWRCHLCKTTFKNKLSLIQHITTVHQLQVCAICTSSFETVRMLQKHLLDKHAKYICGVCKRIFQGQKAMNKHHCLGHSDFHISKRLSNHLNVGVKAGPKRLSCKFCNAVIYQIHNISLKLHVAAEHPEKMVQCTVCPRKFISSNSMQFHIQNVHNAQFLFCEHCKYSARTKWSFVQHWRRAHQMPIVEPIRAKPERNLDFIQITHKIPTSRTYGNKKLLKKVEPNVVDFKM